MRITEESDFLLKFYELIGRTQGKINYIDYGGYIFSLFFLRYISCKSSEIYLDSYDNTDVVENTNIYALAIEFNVPPESQWDFIVKSTNSNAITIVIKNAMNSIEMNNKQLNKLTKDLKYHNNLINENYYIKQMIYFINKEKIEKEYFWFKILKKIYNHLIVYTKSNNYSNLEEIMAYLEEIYSN